MRRPLSSRRLSRCPHALRDALISLRDLLTSAGPVLLLVAAVLGAAYWWLDPQPPNTVTLATGPAGSAYAAFGQRYAEALAADGITVKLLPTNGTVGNLQALREGRADLAFVRGGIGATPALMSLGSLFYEPLWIFYRPAALDSGPQAPLDSLTQLRGLRVNVDQDGSGVPDLVQRLLWANGLSSDELRLSNLPPDEAAQALLAGQLDVVVLITAPETVTVVRLLLAPDVALADLGQADALARRFPFLQTVSLPRGMVDLAGDRPPQSIGLLAATTSRISTTTGASISRSSSTLTVSMIRPLAHQATRTAPITPISGSSQPQPSIQPPSRATMASTEVAASVRTCT